MADYVFHDEVVKNKTPDTLMGFLMFGIAVAGKNSRTTSNKIKDLVDSSSSNTGSPVKAVQNMYASEQLFPGVIEQALRIQKTGKYKVLTKAYSYLGSRPFDLATISLDELLSIPGVGPKTARYFLMYGQESTKHAALDTHILKFLREFLGINAPKQTPGNPKLYAELENSFVTQAEQLKLTPKELDNLVWQYYSRDNKTLLKHILPIEFTAADIQELYDIQGQIDATT